MTNITRVAVVYHSGYGHTAKQAEAVAKGAGSVAGTEALLISVEDIDQYWETLEGVDAIIFGSPTYMGSASAQFKGFMDATSRTVFAKGGVWGNKIAAGLPMPPPVPVTNWQPCSNCRSSPRSTACTGSTWVFHRVTTAPKPRKTC
ncbi:flavodoxin family protein [Pseudomonas sp. B28(2017)]|uniref:flavodoxin family protein n=1 Tax=Pseudomonas sp. B28(2017) TaxID=1981730 RepID=UPI0035326A59